MLRCKTLCATGSYLLVARTPRTPCPGVLRCHTVELPGLRVQGCSGVTDACQDSAFWSGSRAVDLSPDSGSGAESLGLFAPLLNSLDSVSRGAPVPEDALLTLG